MEDLIESIKEDRAELEAQIFELIQVFESNTKTQVGKIELISPPPVTSCGTYRVVGISVDVLIPKQ